MMPLNMMRPGDTMHISACNADGALRGHLENLGLIPGRNVTMIAVRDGSVILGINDGRLALNRGMASVILVEPVSESNELLGSLKQEHIGGHDQDHGAGGGLHAGRRKNKDRLDIKKNHS